jgi:hypothetical protein
MFIGHFAPALWAASRTRSPSLPVLFVAAQLVDWAFFGLLALGVERMRIAPGTTRMNPFDLHHMPYTHSLLGGLGWAIGFALLVYAAHRRDWRAAAWAGAVVLTHWFVDLLVHVPDLTLLGVPPKFGMGLWNHPAVAMPLELGITLAALWLYARATGGWRVPVVGLGVLLLLLQAVDWFGNKPTAVGLAISVLAWSAYAAATLAAWWASHGEQREARGRSRKAGRLV